MIFITIIYILKIENEISKKEMQKYEIKNSYKNIIYRNFHHKFKSESSFFSSSCLRRNYDALINLLRRVKIKLLHLIQDAFFY
jgi:hypothetical protein